MTLLIQLLFLVLLLACSAFCSSAEAAYFSLNPLDVRRIGQRRPGMGEAVHRILSNPTRLLSSVLIGNTIVNTVLSALGYAILEALLPSHGMSIAIPAMTVILVIFGEVGPKRVALLMPLGMASFYVPAVRVLIAVTSPVRVVLERLTRRLEPLFRPRGRTLSQEEFETVVDISGEQGIINAEELGMIKAVIRMDELKVSDAMTPRVDLVGIRLADLAASALATASKSKVKYLLVYRDTLDNVESLLDVRRFLLDPEHRCDAALIPPTYVAESCPLSRLLSRFQKERKRIAVVIDEYGGTAGIISRGDILEEIAGDVYEEMSKPRPLFQQAGPHRWLVDASFSIDELNRKLRLHLDGGDMDRLSGWISAHCDHIPQPDDVVEAQGCRVTVLQTRKHRVEMAQIEKLSEDMP